MLIGKVSVVDRKKQNSCESPSWTPSFLVTEFMSGTMAEAAALRPEDRAPTTSHHVIPSLAAKRKNVATVSYTHLTLPTICSV